MANSKYLTAPESTTKMPKAIPTILINEAAERFAFYGVVAIQTVFMVNYLINWEGKPANFTEAKAMEWIHSFKALVYFVPIIGALISDIFLGKFKTIIPFSILYCCGFIALIADQTYTGAIIGFSLIALGTGIIKPCISANVGDQFSRTNENLMSKVFSWFYFSINLGSFVAMALIPVLLDKFGPEVAFAVPGVFMVIATLTYWTGRKKLVHIPAKGSEFKKETFSAEGLKAVAKLFFCIYIFVAIFWALFDQTTSKWVLQAEKMDLNLMGFTLLPSQLQAVNPLLVMALIPLFAYLIYPVVGKVIKVTPLRKIAAGFFVAAMAFAISASIDTKLKGGDIFKFTSSEKTKSFTTAMMIDGNRDGGGWSSSDQPSEEEPQELIVRLRERKQWDVSQINLIPETVFSSDGIVDVLKSIKEDVKKELTAAKSKAVELDVSDESDLSVEVLKERVKIVNAAIKDVKKTAKGYKSDRRNAQMLTSAREIAQKAIEHVDADVMLLDNAMYMPKEISVYAADLTDKLIPFLIDEMASKKEELEASLEKEKNDEKIAEMQSELADLTEKLSDMSQTAIKCGWIWLGDIAVNTDGQPVALDFDSMKATHVLVQVRSNYGAPKVRIGEFEINTTESMPAVSEEVTAQIWPNVAAIGFKPNIIWQVIAYILITAAEVMLSITVLEFSYTQAPKKMKSFISSISLLSITLGNFFVIGVNHFIQKPDGTTTLEGADYYWFFVVSVVITGILFSIVAIFFKEKTYIQGEASAEVAAE